MSHCILPRDVAFTSLWSRICSLLLTILVASLFCTSAVGQGNGAAAASQTTPYGIGQANDIPAATPQSDMSANDESGKPQQQPADVQQSDSTASQPTMSAEQIIAILQQQPDLLASFKDEAAQELGVDPGTISDDAVYNRIQQDANARVQATKELNRLGYSTNPPAESKTVPGKGEE